MTRQQDPTRTLLAPAAAGAAAAFVLFLLLLTYGRPWDLLPRETLGNFYDAQAESFSHGNLAVDPAEVSFEGFLVNGRTYMYQGPVPALMRLPLVAVTHRFHGRLTRLSMLAAYATALWFVVRLQLLVRRTVDGDLPIAAGERMWMGITSFGIGASSLLFLASKAWVYHEALLWGVAFSVGSLFHLSAWLAVGDRRSAERWWGGRHLVSAAVFGGLALLTRSSVGAGPIAALLLAGLVEAVVILGRRRSSDRPGPTRWSTRVASLGGWRRASGAGLGVLVLGVVVPVGLYMAINQAKFGSLLTLPADKQVLVQFDKERQDFFASNGNSLFGAKYVPSVVTQAFRPDALSIGGLFPFVGFSRTRPAALGGVLFAERDWSSSVPSSEPLLAVLGLAGLVALVVPKRAGAADIVTLRIPVLGALGGCLGFFAIGYMANRYMSDLLPALALLAVVGSQILGGWVRRSQRLVRGLASALLAGLAVWGAWANLGLGLEYQRVIAPGTPAAKRAAWLELQTHLGTTPPPVRIRRFDPLPDSPGLGDIAVIGDCDGLYRSNGAIWLPLEGGPAVGRFTGTLRLGSRPDSAVSLLSTRAATGENLLEVEPAGRDRFRFVAVSRKGGVTTRSLPGPPIALSVGRSYRVDITFDWRSGYAEVLHGARSWLASNIALVPSIPSVDRSFPGSLLLERPSLTACRSLGSGS